MKLFSIKKLIEEKYKNRTPLQTLTSTRNITDRSYSNLNTESSYRDKNISNNQKMSNLKDNFEISVIKQKNFNSDDNVRFSCLNTERISRIRNSSRNSLKFTYSIKNLNNSKNFDGGSLHKTPKIHLSILNENSTHVDMSTVAVIIRIKASFFDIKCVLARLEFYYF